MTKNVHSIIFNWHQVGGTSDRDGCGENYEKYEINKNGVVAIIEEKDNNGFSYVVQIQSNIGIQTHRIFNPNHVVYVV